MWMTALVLFAIAAVGGVALAGMRLSGRELPPMGLAIVHGLFAAAGLVVLILGVMQSAAAGTAGIALAIFLVAALGGFLLFSYHLRKRALPVPLVAVHGLVAVAGFVTLLVWYLGTTR